MKRNLWIYGAALLLGVSGYGIYRSIASESSSFRVDTALLNNGDGVKVRYASSRSADATASSYISDAAAQSLVNEDGTYSLRFVSLIKADSIGEDGKSAVLPGYYGFNVKFTGTGEVDQDYQIQHVYHSISETKDGDTHYYVNDYSAYVGQANASPFSAMPVIGSEDYDLVVALTITNIPSTYTETLFTVTPYVELDGVKSYGNTKRVNLDAVNQSKSLYFVHDGENYLLMDETSEDVYTLKGDFASGDVLSIVSSNGKHCDSALSEVESESTAWSYSCVLDGGYTVTATKGSSIEVEEPVQVKIVTDGNTAFTYDGQPHSPTGLRFVDASNVEVNVPESAYTVHYSSDSTGYYSSEAPTEAAYYSMVVTFTDSKYQMIAGERNYVVFHIDAPTEDTKVIVNFSSDTVFDFDGSAHTPTIASFTDESGNPLDISADKYTVHYEKNEAFYSSEAPSESGTYAMVVTFVEGSGYVAKVDTANGIRNWCVFTINAPVEDVVVNVKFGSTVAFEYDGEPHSPTIVSFTDENGGTLEIPAGAYTIHYSSDSTGYFSSEAPREVAWYSMVITFSDDSGYVLSNGSKKTWCVFHIDEAQVSASYEGFESIYSGSMSNVVDGDDDTFVWFGSVPTTDSTITVDLKKVTEISDIRILTGNATGTDTFDAVVSVSENGVDYVEVGNLSYGTTLTTVDLRNQEQSARYIRLSSLDSGGAWVALKEISVNQLPALNKSVSYGNISLETSVQTSANYMIDGDLSTYAWFGYNRTEGAYLLLDLLEVKTIDTVTLYMGKDDSPDDYFHHYEILTSENGTDYVSLGTFEAKELTLNLETAVNARYVKVLALSLDADNGIVVREFSAEKSPVKVEAVTDRWGSEEDGNQGVSAENVTFNDDGSILVQMKGADRIGGVVKSVERYGEGSFEIVASTTATSGVATAFWLYYNDGVHNYEIDIEMWGDNHIWLTSWVTESDYKTVQLNLDYTLSSDERHTYRIDWYSGTKAEFYVDNVLLTTITEYVPTEPMYLYMGGWCPDWAGDPVSSDSTITIESFSYREW